jgi:glycosyltransferase involved in cell wall biosynthesis
MDAIPIRSGGKSSREEGPDAELSIIVPLYNEEDNVLPLHAAVSDALAAFPRSYELVLVDDGSRDCTFARAAAIVAEDARVRVVGLRRNFGQTAAMAAGIQAARGRVIVTMDGDLQNDPRDIPALVALLDQDYDLATGWRRKRQDRGARVAISKIANRIMNAVLGASIRDSGCSLKAYRAELIRGLPLHGEMHRFIPALSQLAGARLVQIEVRHHARRFGASKYGFSRIYKVMLDIVSIRFLLSFAAQPARSLLWPIGLLLVPASLLSIEAGLDRSASVVLSSIAIMLGATASILICWMLVALIFASTEPRTAHFARIAAEIRRPHATSPSGEPH